MNQVLADTITYEQFLALPWAQIERMELVRGVMVPKHAGEENPVAMSPGGEHGVIQSQIDFLIKLWVRQYKAGQSGTEMGFLLKREPPTVRLPDVAFVRKDLIPSSGIPNGFWELAPDLVVEVVSPWETATEVQAKVRDYIDAGTPLVLVAYPDLVEVIAYTHDRRSRRYGEGDILRFPDVLPGFECRVEDYFDTSV